MAAEPLRSELLTTIEELERLRGGWDELAVAAGRPGSAPAWLLAWARHMAPRPLRVRSAATYSGSRLVGLAPYLVARRRDRVLRARPLGSGLTHRLAPLSAHAPRPAVLREAARVLASSDPRPGVVSFEGIEEGSGALAALVEGAGATGRARSVHERALEAPTIRVASRSHAAWLASRSAQFRQQVRSRGRKLAAAGAGFHVAEDGDGLRRGARALVELYGRRWPGRRSLAGPALEATLVAAGDELLDDGRLRLWTLEAGGRVVSAQLFLAAGGEVSYWGGAFDPAWAEHTPGLLTVLAGIEDAFVRGAARVDLGGGAHPYKRRLADGADRLAWVSVLPQRPGQRAAWMATELAHAGRRVRAGVRELLPFRR